MSLHLPALARRTVMVAGVTLLMTACAGMKPPATVADSIAKNPSLSTLNTLLGTAGLSDALKAAGPFTVFAPTNDAFKAVPAATLADLQQHPDKLAQVLTYHVVPGKLLAADIKNGKVKSLQGAELELSKSGTFVTVESAVVTAPDQTAGNGVVHTIDTVLLPPVKK